MTFRQNQLLEFLKARLAETGVCPSFEEMKVALEQKSKSGVHRLISALEAQGYILRHPGCARAIEVLDKQIVPTQLAAKAIAFQDAPISAFTWAELVEELRRRGFDISINSLPAVAA